MSRIAPSPYDKPAWRRLRLKILARDGHRCYELGCPNPATEVDHIQPVSEAPHLFLDPDNVRAACKFHNVSRVSTRAAAVVRINQLVGTRRPWR
jgi:5-methylcytosine-specific restriction endonuclease McrA